MAIGKSQRRSALAAQWPKELCLHMLRAAEKAWEVEYDQMGIGLAETMDGGQHYALPVEPLPSPEGELRRQLEKVDWRGGQYDYIYFEGVARQAPYRIRRALAHLHVVLGHPSHDRLSRMLQVAGSGQMVTTTAHGLRCQICEAVRPAGAEPKASGERVTRFGEKVLSDSFYVWDHAGERFNVTHMLDSLTDYRIGVVSKTPSAQVTAEILQHRWCGVFGVPETFQTDAGKEYEEVVSRLCRILDFRHEVVPPSAMLCGEEQVGQPYGLVTAAGCDRSQHFSADVHHGSVVQWSGEASLECPTGCERGTEESREDQGGCH